jgi:hypothetical protein
VRERFGPVTVPATVLRDGGQPRQLAGQPLLGLPAAELRQGRALLIYWSYESGREDYSTRDSCASIKRMGSVVTHFFTKTRWERLFHQIR